MAAACGSYFVLDCVQYFYVEQFKLYEKEIEMGVFYFKVPLGCSVIKSVIMKTR